MPYINSTKFGEIVIDNKKYGQVLISDNEVFERDDKKLHQLFEITYLATKNIWKNYLNKN